MVETIPIPVDTAYEVEINEFVGAIHDGAPLSVSLDEALRVVAIAELAQKATGTLVTERDLATIQ